MILDFVVKEIPGAAVGFVVGAFCPAVLRKVKAFFVKETTALKSDIKADATKVEKKL